MVLLFAVDDVVDIKFDGERAKDRKLEKGTIGLYFIKPMLEEFLRDWSDFKMPYEKERNEIYHI